MKLKINRWNIIVEENETIESAKTKLAKAKDEWEKIKINRKEYRE